MIQRAGYDLLRVALRIAVQLWPLWLFWFAWSFADTFYRDTVLLGSAHIGGLSAQQMSWNQYVLWRAWPVAALLGPALLTFLAVMAYRARLFGRLMGIAGIARHGDRHRAYRLSRGAAPGRLPRSGLRPERRAASS